MTIYCNNNPVAVDNDINLHQFLELNNFLHSKGIAVAVNNKVITKNNWLNYNLADKDKVLIISAAKGG